MVFDGAGQLVSGAGDLPIGSARDALYRDLASQAGARASLSKPFADPDSDHMSVALTRRLSSPDGTPSDLVALTLRLSYFRDLFVKLAVGDGGAVALIRADGTVLLRQPSSGALRTNADVADRPAFRAMLAEPSGLIDLPHATAGAPRLVAFGAIPRFSLIAAVSTSYTSIYGGWEWRAIAMGAVMFGVCFLALMLAVALRQELKRRVRAETHLATLAITDPLTGLANRRRFDEVLEREWRRTGRTGSSLALLMIDADRFKDLNDMFGHLRGDEILRALARIIAQSVRETEDLAARYGGEEFAVILPDISADEALRVAERIRVRTGQERVQASRSVSWDLSVSIGVAFARPDLSAQAIDLIEAADRALYAAKDGGRDRVVVTIMTEPGEAPRHQDRADGAALRSPAG
ncbi:GGDEF domain-containing protein [Segnochrobactrum spirostomi]|uniref:diguanylate cyclase n=1 Tax=Segnochrobactrum spirostomi TaxID=2608987 RepID=A0A6A7XXQ0_9HYPH|nr:diguanylate cyclase [Segnochrobactrum spirostomi]MQT11460.1 diguanylate cyclase [Segnochrobactrum spirostomi]